MSDKAGNPPPSARAQRRARQRALIEEKTGANVTVAPKLVGAGRKRSLDDTQEQLDATVKSLHGIASQHCTKAEAAAMLGVAPSTIFDLFLRYPDLHAVWMDGKLVGQSSLRRSQMKLAEKNPQMAIKLGELILGQRDPYKMAEAADRVRALGIREAELEHKEAELALRERAVIAQEKTLALKNPADLGSGLPIDISSLSLAQLMQLAARIREAMVSSGGLTLSAVNTPQAAE